MKTIGIEYPDEPGRKPKRKAGQKPEPEPEPETQAEPEEARPDGGA